MASGNPEIIYGVQLLDDLHNYFPDLLYNNQRFTTVQSVLQYLTSSTRRRFDLFSYGRTQYNHRHNNTRQNSDTKNDEEEEDEETEDDEGDEAENIQSVSESTAAAAIPVTPPSRVGGASARGASPLPGGRVQRSYASVLAGTPGTAYHTQNLFSLFLSSYFLVTK
jgi:hypothetical protein